MLFRAGSNLILLSVHKSARGRVVCSGGNSTGRWYGQSAPDGNFSLFGLKEKCKDALKQKRDILYMQKFVKF